MAKNKLSLKAGCKVCSHERETFDKAPKTSKAVKGVTSLTSKEELFGAEELHRSVITKVSKRRKLVT